MNVRGDQWKQPNPPERRTEKPAAVPGAARAIAMRTIRLALSDATLSKCSDIGTMDARPKRTPRPGGQSAGPSQAPGFCDRQPRRVNLSSFKARQLGDKRPPEGGLLNKDSRSGDRDCRAGPGPAKPDEAHRREADAHHRPSRRLGNAAGNVDCVIAPLKPFELI